MTKNTIRYVGFAAASLVLGAGIPVAHAQAVKPRFLLILDTSSSMTENPGSTNSYGDGSPGFEGCNIDGQPATGWPYDDSRIYQAKGAISDTVAGFGAAEFAFARFRGVDLGQSCTSTADCPKDPNTNTTWSGVSCVRPNDTACQAGDTNCACKYKANHYNCSNNCPARCLSSTRDQILYRTTACRGNTCVWNGNMPGSCKAAQILVPFPTSGSNYAQIEKWIDGTENPGPFAPGQVNPDPEIRVDVGTPLGSTLDSAREWLTVATATDVGPGAGPITSDPKIACREYNVILLTDGNETCKSDPALAASRLHQTCTNGGTWNAANSRCELGGSPKGTRAIKVYVIGFGVTGGSQASLQSIATQGGTGSAYFPSNRAELTAALGSIISASLPRPTCDCDGACDSATGDDKANFPSKGTACSVGVGQCQRTGVYGCTGDGSGTWCAVADLCPSVQLQPGTPATEICNGLDDDCDGQIDEGLGCMCSQKPELCNGMDDNCNNVADEGIPSVACGLNVGICKPGMSKCVGGQTICEGATQPTVEMCNNLDDNCNGVTDDLPAQACFPTPFTGCTYDAMTKMYTCKGVCQPGIQACVMGMWGTCVGAVTPIPEIPCDKRDNNCDGMVDENDPTANDKCFPAGVMGCDEAAGTCMGECKLGRKACTPTGQITCEGFVGPVPELCNGKDDDCDGMVDEDFKDMTARPTDHLGKACDNGAMGPCKRTGMFICRPDGAGTICDAKGSEMTDEVCDGVDNNCNGDVDNQMGKDGPLPGVGVPCGSPVGQCMRGISMCVMGKIVCNDKGPGMEVCDGLDNDCNGAVDDKLTPPGTSCPPPGVPPERAMTGECKPGAFVCAPGPDGKWGWQCRGFVGPQMEICDGKDNDCDGVVDNMAMCPPSNRCVDGMCIPVCGTGEFQCTPDRTCRDGLCRLKACVGVTCPESAYCNNETGMCVDYCATVTCAKGADCVRGGCIDCFNDPTRCKTGERCIAGECQRDPCAEVTCPNDSYCRAGTCVKTCLESCPTGQACRDGRCVEDRCAVANCPVNSFCDPADGACKSDPCQLIQCMGGMACIKTTGKCAADPCLATSCRGNDTCETTATGEAQCVPPTGQLSTRQITKVQTAGGGLSDCDCSLGAAPAGHSTPFAGWLLIAGVAVLAFTRRRRS